ncbi:MAG: aspartyl/asparaginyl beta-hydroxylase domain-containing protein, partial [Kiloniellales bacterium]
APDPDRLRRDLEAVQAKVQAVEHDIVWHHDGGWKAIGLVTADGDIEQNRLAARSRYEKTAAMAHCPYIEAFIEGLGIATRRVRLLSLAPGGRVYWHHDATKAMDGHHDGHVARVHVPIVTAAEIDFQISHETCVWQPGEVWWGDFSFPHRVANRSPVNRVHLVMDLVVDNAFLAMMPEWFRTQRAARIRARRLAVTACNAWYLHREYRPRALVRLKRRLIGSAFSRTRRAAR